MSETTYSYVGTAAIIITMAALWIFMFIPLFGILVFIVEIVLGVNLIKRIWKGHAGLLG